MFCYAEVLIYSLTCPKRPTFGKTWWKIRLFFPGISSNKLLRPVYLHPRCLHAQNMAVGQKVGIQNNRYWILLATGNMNKNRVGVPRLCFLPHGNVKSVWLFFLFCSGSFCFQVSSPLAFFVSNGGDLKANVGSSASGRGSMRPGLTDY